MNSLLRKKGLFWDVDPEQLDLAKNRDFIISRVAEQGDIEDLKYLVQLYSKDQIADTIKNTRLISTKTATFFKIILDIKEPILCLTPSYQSTQKTLWKK